MTRSARYCVICAALLLGVSFSTQLALAQDSWNHGFGPRNYGYSGNAYSQSYVNPGYSTGYSNGYAYPGGLGFGYYNSYVTGFSPYYGVYPYNVYDGVGLGVTPYGVYGFSGAPSYYGSYYAPYGNFAPYRNFHVNPNIRAARPKKPKAVKQPAAKKAHEKKPEEKNPPGGAARAW